MRIFTAAFYKGVSLFFALLYTAVLPLSCLSGAVVKGPALQGVTVTAHAGCMGLPENSVVAMEMGVAAGADIVEFDLNFRATARPCSPTTIPERATARRLPTPSRFWRRIRT